MPEFVTVLFLFLVFACEVCRILAPQPGLEPAPPIEEVLTTENSEGSPHPQPLHLPEQY